MHKVIGVLGGMGPEATILLMSRLLAATPANDDADHIPLLVDSNSQVPSRIAHLIDGTGEDPTPILVEMAQKLADGGAAFLAMPCNTAHSYYPAIAEAVQVPVLNMVELTAAAVVKAFPEGAVGILASPATEIMAVFEGAFSDFGRTVIYPANRDRILSAIQAIKAGRIEAAIPILEEAAAELAIEGASVAVIGCSEFSIVAHRLASGPLALIDSLDVLVDACVGHATNYVALAKQGAKLAK